MIGVVICLSIFCAPISKFIFSSFMTVKFKNYICSDMFFLHFPHHMPVHMTADIDCHRKSCNMCRVSIHIHCESSGCSAKSTRSDSKPIDFSNISSSNSFTYGIAECSPTGLVNAFLLKSHIFQKYRQYQLRQPLADRHSVLHPSLL